MRKIRYFGKFMFSQIFNQMTQGCLPKVRYVDVLSIRNRMYTTIPCKGKNPDQKILCFREEILVSNLLKSSTPPLLDFVKILHNIITVYFFNESIWSQNGNEIEVGEMSCSPCSDSFRCCYELFCLMWNTFYQQGNVLQWSDNPKQ